MTETRIIGDVHGKFNGYFQTIAGCEQSIQVGDFGIGFDLLRPEKFRGRDPMVLPEGHVFIRGNHDNPESCRLHPNCIRDGSFDGRSFFVGGAWSIDKDFRTPGIDWWEDEELGYEALEDIIDEYEDIRPNIMFTHDAPYSIASALFEGQLLGGRDAKLTKTRTGMALESMWNIHQPKLWVFGHYHIDTDVHIEGCRFICLDELSYVDIDLEYYK